jgi:hypothetical protein
MIAGDPSVFAIESEITEALENPGQMALGFFIIHVGGRAFGVKEPDASCLGCSFNEVEARLRRRGMHMSPFPTDYHAADVAEAYLDAIYRDTPRRDYVGLSRQEFVEAIYTSAVIWAPDGDETFDDGSHVLQFDVGSRVRIIAFVNTESPDDLTGTIKEEWLDANFFYSVMSDWKTLITAERADRLKTNTRSPEAES